MKVVLAQIDPIVTDFRGNLEKIKYAYEKAEAVGARLVVTPELSLSGYPPMDLMDRPEIFTRNEKYILEVAALTKGKKAALAVGHIARNRKETGRMGRNRMSIFEDGCEVFFQDKTLLPTYDVFDEARFFEPADEIKVWDCDGKKICVAICEDLWANDPLVERKIYKKDPVEDICALKPDLVVSASASPYIYGKRERREAIHIEISKKVGAPLIYVNQTGATDEVLFDGGSFYVADGKVAARLPLFSKALGLVDPFGGEVSDCLEGKLENDSPQELVVLIRGLEEGIRSYFHRTGFKKAVLGLSGGIDSAVVAVLATRALGAENVFGISMPGPHSSGHSIADAETLAKNLGIKYKVHPIKFLFSMAAKHVEEITGELKGVAHENLQARIRGLTLMSLSNQTGALVLTTGNKSELAVGYATLYGDMVGALAPIGDVFKTRVYEIARALNSEKELIPRNTLEKPPSAELRPGQTDRDSLPPYDELDLFLEAYLEQKRPQVELAGHGEWVADILKKIELSEYKRHQYAPVLKTSPRAFGLGRRIPISKSWNIHRN